MAAWQKPVGSMRLRPPELDHGGASHELIMQLRRCGIGKFHQAAIGGFYTRRRSVSWEEKARRGLDNAATRGGARCGYPCSAAGGPGRARRRAVAQRRASVAAVGADRQDRRGGGRRLARGPGSASNDGLPWAGPERTVPHFYFD
jgi:hypothetical protein